MTENEKKEIPSIDIRIDKDGVWYYEGNEMFRKDILSTFFQELERDSTGRYVIRHNEQVFAITVEDVPFAVKSIEPSQDEQGREGYFNILLTDDSVETLDPATLRMGEDNVLYCAVKDKRFEARFTRKSYYQFAEHIQYDSDKDMYYIKLNDTIYEISPKG